MDSQRGSWAALLVLIILAALALGGGLVGCPHYRVWERKMAGQAELQYQQGARQALIAQAQAEDEAAVARAEAAKQGCEDLGRPGDRDCEDALLRDAATYSIAKEGHEGVIISVGQPVSVAVNPNQRRPNAD